MRDRVAIVLLILVALALAAPLWGPGMVNTRGGGDSPFLLQRLHQMVVNLRAGVFPVRWMPDAAYGLGYPFFSYYAALPYYLAGFLAVAGFDLLTALKLIQSVGFVASALTMYGWMRHIASNRWMAWLAAVAYVAAPFHLVNVYVRGDSLSEFYAFVFYPLILWGLDRTASRAARGATGAQWLVPAAAYAGLICSHNVSALIFSPFALLYPLALLPPRASGGARARLRVLAPCYLALGLGLLLSAWVWLPALAEQGYVQTQTLTGGYFDYTRHFRTANVVQPGLLFDYDVGSSVSTPFAMGALQAGLAVGGALLLLARRLRLASTGGATGGRSRFVLFGLLLSTAMVTPLSKPLWEHMPLLPLVQFPWRFLSVQALFGAATASAWVPRGQWGRWISLLLGGTAIAAVLVPLRPERIAIGPADVTTERLQVFELFTQNIGSTVGAEYLPRATVPRPYTSDLLVEPDAPQPAIPLDGAAVEATLVERRPTRLLWRVEGAGGRLALPLLDWPGWSATVDGAPVAIEPLEGAGLATVSVPAGAHDLVLRLRRTPVRALAEGLSWSALLITVAVCWSARRRIRWTSALGHLALAIFPAFAFLLLPQQPIIAASTLTMDFDQSPYLHAALGPGGVAGVPFGDGIRLSRYTYSARTLAPGETLRVSLDWHGADDTYTVTLELVSPAAVRMALTPLAQATAPVSASAQGLALRLPEDLSRGVYFVRVRLFGPRGEIRARTSAGRSRGTLYLEPVRVVAGPSLPADLPVLAPFGPAIRLHTATVQQDAPDRLRVRLGWSVRYRLGANYGISLRLLDGDERIIATLDTQPGYGYLPTGMWRPGELATDWLQLPLPQDLPGGDGYRLLVILYQVHSGQAIGQALLGPFPLPLERPFEAQPAPRVFDLPVFASEGYPRRLGATFGQELRLAGYALEQRAAVLCLTPWWQAIHTPSADYTVFVHLFDPLTETIVAQDDAMPRRGTYPTSWWQPNEVVSDTICLSLSGVQAGEYRLGVGVYDRSLNRLAAVDADGNALPDARLVLPEPVEVAP
jgi:hypothetical protein